MATLLGGTLQTLGILALTAVVVLFGWEVWTNGFDVDRAVERTSRRVFGVFAGAASAAMTAVVVGVDVALQAPELLITLLGIGSIFAGVSWPMFAATAFVAWAVAEAVNGGPR
jgi:hypothetical protein